MSAPFAIDVHTHFVPERFAAAPPPDTRDWPSIAPGSSCGHANVMINGKNYRTVSDRCWSAARRIEDMPGMGVTRQVISPMPELLSYWLPVEHARVILRDMNEQLAALVNAHPDRFHGLGALPLQDVPAALEELEHIKKLGLIGVEIGSNINGRDIGDPEFEPFFAAAERLDMAVFVHSLKPRVKFGGPTQLGPVVGFPFESGMAAVSAITSNLVVRHPRLRICFSHGGGALPSLLARFHHCYQSLPPLKEAMPTAPADQARLMYYDCCVFSVPGIRHLIEVFGEDRLVAGSDYPFARAETEPIAKIEAATLDEDIRSKLRYRNALAFLGLKS